MDDLVAWLRATIEGDLAAARVLDGQAWHVDEEGCGWFFISQGEGDPLAKSCGCCSVGTLTREQAEHIVLQQPRDAIARCEADLTILDRVIPEVRDSDVRIADEFGAGWPDNELTPTEELLLRAMASGYRHREGYRPEWAPEE